MPYAFCRTLRGSTAFLLLVLCVPCFAQDVRIGVLGLFHPREVVLQAVAGSAVTISAGGRSFVLEPSSGTNHVSLRLDPDDVAVEIEDAVIRGRSLSVTSRDHGPAEFSLSVPGKLTRRYRGTLEVRPSSGLLVLIVSMDLETAVASIVAAESNPDTPVEALKAQAVATRSYLIAAKGRHRGFDFCDTTHCQFLRTPPDANTRVARAVASTRGLVLAYNSQPFAAMYTRSCGGRTRTPREVGLPAGPYPYYSVECKYCRQHPSAWESRITSQQAACLDASSESARLDLDRLLGWSAVPSNNYTVKRMGTRVLLEGVGEGHGIGLCQSGAAAMAKEGANFTQILAQYYPNASVTNYVRANP